MLGLRILVVDDDRQTREVVDAKLRQAGHTVSCAADGVEAIDLVRGKLFDVVVTDILMPNKDGFEVIAELRRRHGGVRIVAMSGGGRRNQEQYLKTASSLGAHATLMKPFSFSDLTLVLRPSTTGAPAQ